MVHSEILNAHIEVVCTKRGIKLVDEAGGFDHYLLNTPVNEVYATGLLRLKRELLLALADKENFTTKHGGNPDVFEKYQKYAVSHDEADWHGLSFVEAMRKQAKIAALDAEKSITPDKVKFRQDHQQLQECGQTGWWQLPVAISLLIDKGCPEADGPGVGTRKVD